MTQKTLCSYGLTYKKAETLIKNGADVNETDIYGATPLFYVKYIDFTRLSINNGADVNIHINIKDGYGSTDLFRRRSINIIKLLIKNGANTNIVNKSGYPAFYDFKIYYNINILNEFLRAGADPNYLSPSGTLLSIAHRGVFIPQESIILIRKYGGIASDIQTYQYLRNLFSTDEQKAFDGFSSITNNDGDFFQMCLAYQNDKKNNVKIEIQDINIL